MWLVHLIVVWCLHFCLSFDITDDVFGNFRHGMPAAFGDFNSDELTDLMVITDEGRTVEVLIANPEKPFLRSDRISCTFDSVRIKGVVPGDFDGDGNMDLMIVGRHREDTDHKTRLFILWGDSRKLKCQKDDNESVLTLIGQPLVLDCNDDFIHDIFGVDYSDGQRKFWTFSEMRGLNKAEVMVGQNRTLRVPNSHAFIDLDHNFGADIMLTAENGFEYWLKQGPDFTFSHMVPMPAVSLQGMIGQSFFMDFDLDGRVDHLVPVCDDPMCFNSIIFVYLDGRWTSVELDLKDGNENKWSFVHPSSITRKYLDTLTMRVGDVNLDGYPDLIATLTFNGEVRVFLLENYACKACPLKRKFSLSWSYFNEQNSTVMGTFYDINENGILDTILVKQVGEKAEVVAVKNLLEYDAYFLKVLVLSNRCYTNCSLPKDLPYGTNLPGPSICYKTYTSEGDFRESCIAQLPQSSHFSLQLPFVLFGLGRMPNFVETLQVGVEGGHHVWTQIIPNSQMVVIPPVNGNGKWTGKLFVTPSRAIVLTAVALGGIGALLALLIFALHTREKRDDRIEKLQEAHKFHFDAM